jgi:hypothetical protein
LFEKCFAVTLSTFRSPLALKRGNRNQSPLIHRGILEVSRTFDTPKKTFQATSKIRNLKSKIALLDYVCKLFVNISFSGAFQTIQSKLKETLLMALTQGDIAFISFNADMGLMRSNSPVALTMVSILVPVVDKPVL